MNEKQQQLTFDKGITNVPSDAICSDNALEESIGMVYDDGEHRVIQKPAEKDIDIDGTLLYVHSYGGTDRYIFKDGDSIKWKDTETTATLITLTNGEEFLSAESIGNTLVLSTSKSLYYFLWDSKNTPTYKSLGNQLPDIRVTFSLDDGRTGAETHAEPYIDTTGLTDGWFIHAFTNPETGHVTEYVTGNFIKEGMYEDVKSALIGLVSMRNKEVKEAMRFAFPFWARYAIRLYDGSYTHISNPVLLLPTVLNNWNVFACEKNDSSTPKAMDGDAGGFGPINYMPYSAKLKYTVTYPGGTINKDDWSDIIKGIDIFVSSEVKNFDMEGTWTIQNCYIIKERSDDDVAKLVATTVNPLFQSRTPLVDACQPLYNENIAKLQIPDENDKSTWNTYYKPTAYSEYEIVKKLLDASTFYNIVEHDWPDLHNYNDTYNADARMQKSTLASLTTQTQLDKDDYFSWAPIMGAVMKSYNSRLHLANITRGFFNGFTHFSFTRYTDLTNPSLDRRTLNYYVHINSESGERVVLAPIYQLPEIADIWFYYPDPRAYKVEIYDVTITNDKRHVKTLTLKEHPSLNGAYYFERLPGTGETSSFTPFSGDLPDTNYDPEHLYDQLAVSEANNPYVFNAKGYTTVGMGAIKGLATQTMTLGENEHGIHPLSVFSQKGISLLRLNNEGVYIRSDEISREVCNNPKSITETDGPVFFSSDKGLMVLIGAQVKCVSEQLSGKNGSFEIGGVEQLTDMGSFVDFLKSAVIAYDYRDSLLWIFNNSSDYAWIYNIKSGTFGRYEVDVEQQHVQQQAAPLLQSSPRRSGENATEEQEETTLEFETLPFTGIHAWAGTENTDNDISHLDTSSPVELYFVTGISPVVRFYLKGISTVDNQDTYFTTGWTFEGHTESEYQGAYWIYTSKLFLDDNEHYWVWDETTLVDLGINNPATWSQLPYSRFRSWASNENVVAYSDVDLTKPVYLYWSSGVPSGERWVLGCTDLNGDEAYVLGGWTYDGHTESDYYNDVTTHEVKSGVIFVGNSVQTQYVIVTGDYFHVMSVSQEPTPPGPEPPGPGPEPPTPPTPTVNKITVVNNYPDYLIQFDDTVYSLIERPNINEDDTEYSGTIITRPMKFENAQALKSIMQIMHVKQMQGTMTMRIFASNNLGGNWVELHSLRGTPWKYYKFRFDFTNMKATDRFTGTVLITQERRTNKLR